MCLVELALITVGLVQTVLFWPTSGKEDALICYRYARNWVHGDGLVFNSGEYVEGFSNLLWTFQLAVLHWAGLSLEAADDLLIFSYTALALLVLRSICIRALGDTWAARLPLFLVVSMTAVPASYGNGLEGACAGLAVLLLLSGALARRPWVLTAGAVMLLLLRPEGFAYAGWSFLWLFADSYRDPALRRKAFVCAIATLGAFVALTIFRLTYYGDYIPNTVRAKSGEFQIGSVLAGLRYLCRYAWQIGPLTIALALLATLPRHGRSLWMFAAGLVALNMAVVCRNSGDWMVYFRLLTPFFSLVAFLAGLGMVAVLRNHRTLGPLLVLVGLTAGAWTVLPYDIGALVKSFPFRLAANNRVPDADPGLFDSHVSLHDVGEPDDRWVIEYGGWQGFILEGVRATEMWGLTDREIARSSGPGTSYYPMAGRICWPATFDKRPTYLAFSAECFRARLSAIAATPGLRDVVGGYMVMQDFPINAPKSRFNLFAARCDRKPMSKFVLHYGALAPAMDYVPSGVGDGQSDQGEISLLLDSPFRTAWQKADWSDAKGKRRPTAWMKWDDDLRLSSQLALECGVNRFTREVPDDSPVILVLGRFSLLAPNLRFRVIAMGEDGNEVTVARSELSEPVSEDFILTPLSISNWGGVKPVRMAVELETDSPCAVFLAAHRWARAPLPELPSRFVADTRVPHTETHRGPGLSIIDRTAEQQRTGVDADSGSVEKQFQLAVALAHGGDWTAAEAQLRLVLSKDRSMWPVGAILCAEEAEQRRKDGDPRGAVRLFQMVRMLDPSTLGYALRLAEGLKETGELDAALAQCRVVLFKQPEFPAAADLLDDICGQRGDAGERVAEWRAIAGRHPGDLSATQRLANALEAAGDTSAALSTYGSLLDTSSSTSAASRMDAMLLACNDAPGRAAEWRAMVKQHPKARASCLYLADALAASGEIVSAVDTYRAWLAAHPDDSEAQLGLVDVLARGRDVATALMVAGDAGAAVAKYRELLVANPNDSESQLGLADALARGGDTSAALDTLRALARVKPGRENSAAAALDRVAVAMLEHSEKQAAVEVLRRSVSLESDNFNHAVLLAHVLEQLGDGAGALEQYRTIVLALPESPKSSVRIDAIYGQRGDVAGQVEEWRAITEKNPDAVIPWQHLGAALDQMGDRDGARSARERAERNAGKAGS